MCDYNNLDIEMALMRSLMERMAVPHTGRQGMLNEERHLNEGIDRQVETPDKVFDVLSEIGRNSFVCIGYVTGANLNIPKGKRLNPATKRMNSYDDYEAFGKEIGSEHEIGALVKITSYNFRYFNNDDIAKKYKGEYKTSANDIRAKYGLPPIGDADNVYTQRVDYGGGVELYNGNDESKKGSFYVNANTFGASVHGVVYAVDNEGNIVQELSEEQVKPYLRAKGEEVPGANALRKMGAEEEQVQSYINDIKSLKFIYKRFEGNSILWIAATTNKQKIVYINSNLMKTVNDININPQDFVEKAKERYSVDMTNMPE